MSSHVWVSSPAGRFGETATVRRVVRAIVPVLIGIVLLVSIASYLDPHDV